MNKTQIVTVAVSVVTLCVSGVMVWRAGRQRRQLLNDGAAAILVRRLTRRRFIMGIVLAVVAVMLFLGMCVLDDHFATSPGEFTWFWLCVVALLVWLFGLAIFDMVSVLHSRLEQWQRGTPPPPPAREKPRSQEKGD